MCWKSNNKPELKRATEDIPVFKIVLQNKGLESYYTSFKYQIGKTYTEELDNPLELSELKCYIISEGFHSYSPNKCIIDLVDGIIRVKSSFTLDAFVDRRSVKANCIIPEGAFYYVNSWGEYVSDQIKIINIENVLGN